MIVEKKFYVYLITNIINGKLYVGKGKTNRDRWKEHQRTARGGRAKYPKVYSYVHAAISKYGAENFKYSILEYYEFEKTALANEMSHIAQLKSEGYLLYNLTDGGDGLSGHKRSNETKRKLRLANLGKTHSEKTKQKLSLLAKGRKHTDEAKKKIAVAHLNMYCSEEARQKISLANSGERNVNSKLTWENVRLIRELFANGASHQNLAIQFDVDKSLIGRVCRNQIWITST